MNLAAYLSACLSVLGADDAWQKALDYSRQGFKRSFLAILFSVPCFYICAMAIQSERVRQTGIEASIPNTAFFLIFTLYALVFVVMAYFTVNFFDRHESFRPWVILRHWAIFFTSFLAAIIFGFHLLGYLPFSWASFLVLILYLMTLAIDIRLIQKVVGFDWGVAVLTACLMTAANLMVLLAGVTYYISQ